MPNHRSLLFVPGNRPERFEKACATEADLVCIDLEDAVAPDDKDSARDAVVNFLSQTTCSHVALRINEPGSEACLADQKAIAALTLPFVMVPKVDRADDVLGLNVSAPIMPVLESAKAILNAAEIMALEPVTMALFGGGDYSADLGIPMAFESFLYARSHLANCAVAHDVLLFDVPYLDVHDVDGGQADTARVAALGIPARSAIHPKQIAAIHAALAPSDDEVDQAERLRDAYEKSGGNAALLDGKLIEAPMLKGAERVLERAKRR
jgi:citrate lyase subunit beta/citryl-CoA lyase/(S)-citramalyl-CoA lyase